MIIVKRITGESYDLETGQELPKTLVLGNGSEELSLPINDETALLIIQFMVGERQSPAEPPDFVEEMAKGYEEQDAPSPTPVLSLAPEPNPDDNGDGGLGEWDDPESGIQSI